MFLFRVNKQAADLGQLTALNDLPPLTSAGHDPEE